jgi:single-strand DNA-binding protein
MRDVNKIILVGRLGGDPVQRKTRKGMAVVNFPLATSRRLKNGGAEGATETDRNEETQWHNVVAWDKTAESCAQYLKKGDSVYVEGSVRSHKYNGKDGSVRTSFEVFADAVNFLGGGRQQASVAAESA